MVQLRYLILLVAVGLAVHFFRKRRSATNMEAMPKVGLTELIAAAHGDRAVARRLVEAEMARDSKLTVDAAAVAALRRLKADRR